MKAHIWGSTLVADGKVYLGDEDGDLVVMAHRRKRKSSARQTWARRFIRRQSWRTASSTCIRRAICSRFMTSRRAAELMSRRSLTLTLKNNVWFARKLILEDSIQADNRAKL